MFKFFYRIALKDFKNFFHRANFLALMFFISVMSVNSYAQSINHTNYYSENRIVDFIYKLVNTLQYSKYKLGGSHFDVVRGIYVVDCSSYVDHILKIMYPRAYSTLVAWSGSFAPTTHHYYHFFNGLLDDPHHYWDPVEDVEQLRPGDILVFRYKTKMKNQMQGHVMIVMDKPVRHKNFFSVRIADSAPARHSEDTRRVHVSGIGIGTLLLKVNPKTFRPQAYAWRMGSRFKTVNFAMARPISIG